MSSSGIESNASQAPNGLPEARERLHVAALELHDPSSWTPPSPSLVAALVDLAECSRDDFAVRLGVDASTLRRWTTPEAQASHRAVPYGAWCLALLLTGYARTDTLAFPGWHAPTGAAPPIANRTGQPLAEHGALVARLAEHIIADSYGHPSPGQPDTGSRLGQWRQAAFVAGALHDIGKLDPDFQRYLLQTRARLDRDDAEDGTHIGEDHERGDFGFDRYPRHEEVGWLMVRQLIDGARLQRGALGGEGPNVRPSHSRLGLTEYAIRWHHARPARSPADQERFATAEDIQQRLLQHSSWLEDGACEALQRYLVEIDRLTDASLAETVPADPTYRPADALPTPPFKALYSTPDGLEPHERERTIETEAARTAIRSALVTADRVVSRLRPTELYAHLARGDLPVYVPEGGDLAALHRQIRAMLARFDPAEPRSARQSDAAAALAELTMDGRVACLEGPAGCGKTKIVLEWLAAEHPRRTVIFVPRTAIGEALFDELVRDYRITTNIEYLSGAVKRIRLAGESNTIDTPEHLEGSGDVLITTIDQLCGAMLSHRRIDLVTHLAHSHVVFDEFHELLDLPGIVALFLETMRLRHHCAGATLLVSATPNRAFLERLGVVDADVVRVATFNERPYRLRLEALPDGAYATSSLGRAAPGEHPFVSDGFDPAPGSFVVCNTASLAQQASITARLAGREVLCLHSRFTPADKSRLIGQALDAFGKAPGASPPLLVAGPIVQASLNLSTEHLHTETCTAEHFLQRIGRVNRFAESLSATVDLYVSRRANGRLGNARFLSELRQGARADAFIQAFSAMLEDGGAGRAERTVDLAELYRWYAEFQRTPEAEAAYATDFDALMEDSARLFRERVFDPVQYPGGRSGGRGTLSGRTLRGRSSYVLPLYARVDSHTSRVALSLLWDARSALSDRLTDDLSDTQKDDELTGFYLKLTRGAGKPTYLSPTLIGTEGKRFLAALGRAAAPVRTWPHLRIRARRAELPIIVARERYDERNRYYIDYDGMALGLMAPKRFDEVAAVTMKALVGASRASRR